MKPRRIRLSTTPTQEALDDLRLGDIVYLDGLMYTAREGVYMRALEEQANIPMELPSQSAANFHCSPAARINPDGSFDMGAVTATASFRFAKWLPEWMAKTGAKLNEPRLCGKNTHCCGGPLESLFPSESHRIAGNRTEHLKESGGNVATSPSPGDASKYSEQSTHCQYHLRLSLRL